MHLKTLTVKNFRALEDIHVDFDNRVNVIVGPNAIGKTSVLEAIRLAKAMLAPRTSNESMQALFALGAAVPHMPQRFIIEGIARDSSRPIQIQCRYELSEAELAWIEETTSQIATVLVQSRMGMGFTNQSALIAFLSSEPGKQTLAQAEAEIKKSLDATRTGGRICRLDLLIDPASVRFTGADPIATTIIAVLDQRNPPHRTSFTYFPADRALPSGEQPVQLGAADAVHQLESHNSQPQMKYARLKNTIFNAVVASKEDRDQLEKEFARIFNGILKGRELLRVGVNDLGLLSIKVKDSETGRIFDLDGMSSGEKGLILTFLLIERSVADDGIILLDEPELHLNPAVCKHLLTYLVDNYVIRKNLQVIVCSHSPEILAGAFDRDECSLYHLMSESMLTKVRRKDKDVIYEALRRLGTSYSEGLLFKATIFVEGDDDINILEAGFGDVLHRYKLKDLGGRREIEKQIILLQEEEKKGEKLTSRYFIFDRDEAPSGLTSSESVKILQWTQRCLENYLIDIDVLTDLLKNPEVVKEPLTNQGEVIKRLRTLAYSQLDDYVAKTVYEKYNYYNPGLRVLDIQGKPPLEIAEILWTGLKSVMDQVCALDEANWKAEFWEDCKTARKNIESRWETMWLQDCDGKRLFKELHRSIKFNISLRRFKIRVISEMRIQRSENWRSMESLLKGLLETKSKKSST